AIQRAGLTVTAYMPLAVGKVLEDPTLKKLGEKYDASAAQVALAWLHQKDIVVIPSSTKEAHLKANMAALDITLEQADMDAIEALNRNERIADPDFAPDWD
ncbi:MAG: aldo/keto reductase, partial [Alloalcanivorax venustensis]